MYVRKQMAKTVEVKRGQKGYGSMSCYGAGLFYNLTPKEIEEIEKISDCAFVEEEEMEPVAEPKPEPKSDPAEAMPVPLDDFDEE